VRLIISGGGTGGHVYPALAAVQKLAQQLDDLDVLWVGSQGGMEQALVERAGLKIKPVSAASIRGKNPMAVVGSLWQLSQGCLQSRQIIRRFRPEVLFVTGGYVCVPVALAAWRAGVPIIIYLPDIEPGWAIKFLARFANRVAVTAPEAQQFFKSGLTVVTGYPVQAELFSLRQVGQAEARRQLGLANDWPVLLIFGGSRGARSINQAVTAQLEDYLRASQVIHVCGTLDEPWVRARQVQLPENLQRRYHLSAYLHEEKVAALVAADLMISRAGASVMGELPAAGLPAVLVPYPYAGAHQTLNAAYLARHQAAIIVDNADLNQKLKGIVIDLLTDKEKLKAMSQACQSLAQPDAAARLAQEILGVRNHGRN
jgi:UDP-N-acetylglucosamine--N-acetylmuramyl-(pentapeptide) pyrophosphoryl-undecaprenol N-acetylglucosamine transferase